MSVCKKFPKYFTNFPYLFFKKTILELTSERFVNVTVNLPHRFLGRVLGLKTLKVNALFQTTAITVKSVTPKNAASVVAVFTQRITKTISNAAPEQC